MYLAVYYTVSSISLEGILQRLRCTFQLLFVGVIVHGQMYKNNVEYTFSENVQWHGRRGNGKYRKISRNFGKSDRREQDSQTSKFCLWNRAAYLDSILLIIIVVSEQELNMDIQLPPEIDIDGNNLRLQIRTVENSLQKYASIKAERMAQLEQYKREVIIFIRFLF